MNGAPKNKLLRVKINAMQVIQEVHMQVEVYIYIYIYICPKIEGVRYKCDRIPIALYANSWCKIRFMKPSNTLREPIRRSSH